VSNASAPPPSNATLVFPVANATLSGVIQAIVSAPASSKLVELLVDGSGFTGMGNYGGGSFQAPVNTMQLLNGVHQFAAAVTDASGVKSITAPVNITIQN
jgi:hypothetical protein